MPLTLRGAARCPQTPTQLLSPISTGPRHRSSEGRWVSLNNQVVGTGPLLAPKILCKKCVFKAVHSILCETHCNSCNHTQKLDFAPINRNVYWKRKLHSQKMINNEKMKLNIRKNVTLHEDICIRHCTCLN